jgi:predicted N-acyltransferase
MHLRVLPDLAAVPSRIWNGLDLGANPFVQHEFLRALEETGCVGDGTGWIPQHLALYDRDGERLVGAVPLYLKAHSYGEYVFDWAWAKAYASAGLDYYPKLVAAVPFTPATGPRLLVRPDADRTPVAERLLDGALALAREVGASSLHWLFPTEHELDFLCAHGLLKRRGCQFHWSNPGYRDFDDFLSGFTAQKRKKIRQERRYVREAGVRLRVLTGRDAGTRDWDTLYRFYRSTIARYQGIPYLKRAFFHALGERMPEQVVLVFAEQGHTCVAAALNLRGGDRLYGRYWGGEPGVNGLHFETCYYAAIEYCIAQGLKYYEAGAQGEHKLARGFAPVATYSAHWLAHPRFSGAVADFLNREETAVTHYMDELREHLPFKAPVAENGATRSERV